MVVEWGLGFWRWQRKWKVLGSGQSSRRDGGNDRQMDIIYSNVRIRLFFVCLNSQTMSSPSTLSLACYPHGHCKISKQNYVLETTNIQSLVRTTLINSSSMIQFPITSLPSLFLSPSLTHVFFTHSSYVQQYSLLSFFLSTSYCTS